MMNKDLLFHRAVIGCLVGRLRFVASVNLLIWVFRVIIILCFPRRPCVDR